MLVYIIIAAIILVFLSVGWVIPEKWKKEIEEIEREKSTN